MPDLKADAAAARKVSWGFAPTPEQRAAILRLADMADKLADTDKIGDVIANNSFVDYPANHAAPDYDRAAQTVQDYVRGSDGATSQS